MYERYKSLLSFPRCKSNARDLSMKMSRRCGAEHMDNSRTATRLSILGVYPQAPPALILLNHDIVIITRCLSKLIYNACITFHALLGCGIIIYISIIICGCTRMLRFLTVNTILLTHTGARWHKYPRAFALRNGQDFVRGGAKITCENVRSRQQRVR